MTDEIAELKERIADLEGTLEAMDMMQGADVDEIRQLKEQLRAANVPASADDDLSVAVLALLRGLVIVNPSSEFGRGWTASVSLVKSIIELEIQRRAEEQ